MDMIYFSHNPRGEGGVGGGRKCAAPCHVSQCASCARRFQRVLTYFNSAVKTQQQVGVRDKPRKSICDPSVPPPPTQLGDDIGVLVSVGPQ